MPSLHQSSNGFKRRACQACSKELADILERKLAPGEKRAHKKRKMREKQRKRIGFRRRYERSKKKDRKTEAIARFRELLTLT